MRVNEENWGTWGELDLEYRESLRKVNNYRKEETDISNLEIASSMKNDLKGSIREIKARLLYEYKTLDEETLKELNLTDRQIQIVLLRQKHSCKEIGSMLGLAQSTVFNIYNNVINKITRYNELCIKEKNIFKLSTQQRSLYYLIKQGKNNREIAQILSTSIETIKVQKKRIRKILGGTNS